MSEARDYYVSMIRGEKKKQVAFMAGPFATHEEALAQVDAVKREASRLDTWADFYLFGTCSRPRSPDNKPGWLNVYLGLGTDQTVVPSADRGSL